jgi:hypothetical protein
MTDESVHLLSSASKIERFAVGLGNMFIRIVSNHFLFFILQLIYFRAPSELRPVVCSKSRDQAISATLASSSWRQREHLPMAQRHGT